MSFLTTNNRYPVFDILGPTSRLLWKTNLFTTGHLFPQALECRSSGGLQTLAAGWSYPRRTVKTLHCTLQWLTRQPLTCPNSHEAQTSKALTLTNVSGLNCVWVDGVTGSTYTSFKGYNTTPHVWIDLLRFWIKMMNRIGPRRGPEEHHDPTESLYKRNYQVRQNVPDFLERQTHTRLWGIYVYSKYFYEFSTLECNRVNLCEPFVVI